MNKAIALLFIIQIGTYLLFVVSVHHARIKIPSGVGFEITPSFGFYITLTHDIIAINFFFFKLFFIMTDYIEDTEEKYPELGPYNIEREINDAISVFNIDYLTKAKEIEKICIDVLNQIQVKLDIEFGENTAKLYLSPISNIGKDGSLTHHFDLNIKTNALVNNKEE